MIGSMSRLFSAHLHKVLKSWIFWAGAAFMLCYGIFNTVNACRVGERAYPLFDSMIALFFLLAAFSGGYINSGYHDGTLRGKIVVGHSRAAVYLSNLAAVYLLGIFYMALYILPVFLLGPFLLGPLPNPEEAAAKALCCLLVLLAEASMLALLAMAISSKGAGLLSLVLVWFLFFGSIYLDGMLAEPERLSGGMQPGESHSLAGRAPGPAGSLNPYYVKAPVRNLLGLVLELNPGGQVLRLVENTCRLSPLWVLAANACGAALVSTAAGLLLFEKKDIK